MNFCSDIATIRMPIINIFKSMAYKTRDSQSATVLLSQGERFTTKFEDGIVWFTFEDGEACEAIMDAHVNRELVCPTLDITNAIHEIKKIIIRNKS